MRAYTHQPFHVRRHGSAMELDKMATFMDGRSTQKATPQPKRGSTFPLQGSAMFPSREAEFYRSPPTVKIRKGPKMELLWEQDHVGKLAGMLRTPKDVCFLDDRWASHLYNLD